MISVATSAVVLGQLFGALVYLLEQARVNLGVSLEKAERATLMGVALLCHGSALVKGAARALLGLAEPSRYASLNAQAMRKYAL
jgi:ABC-type enterochelin transport system permease subunit